ncbi:hypothetical protein KDW_39990 [Dictyobacter vulcani]|uniref:Uncharacterized protein n=1 Tax=Dictyobacter vulcani TaxID=2607529 RepID=A0A5J4KTS9_9CHLR|nr:hypothetical protein KDW_39990 [Dictyobacter vulcani]
MVWYDCERNMKSDYYHIKDARLNKRLKRAFGMDERELATLARVDFVRGEGFLFCFVAN